MIMRSRARRCASITVLVGAAFGFAGRDVSAVAPSQVTFRASASAEGVRTGIAATGAPVSNHVVDGASPIAQAAIDTTIGSSALSSVAYPGDLIVTAPGLVAGASGGATSGVVPEYPLVAVAGSTTTPESRVDVPGSSMRAAADARMAAATAKSGAAADGPGNATFFASAEVEVGANSVVRATAASSADAVTIGPLVLGHVAARSTSTRAVGAEVTRDAALDVTGMTVGGIGVQLTGDGLVLAGTTIPVAGSPLQEVLDGAGISVRFVAEEKTADGIVSAGLVVTRTQELPTVISPATVTYIFGRAAAGVSLVSLRVIGEVAASDAPPGQPGPASPDGRKRAASAVGAMPGVGQPSAAAPAGATTEAPKLAQSLSGVFDASTFYLVLVGAGLGAGIVLELFRHLGVRLRWI